MRARNLKPGFFKNEDLAELPHWQRLLFAGTWLLADKAGRLEYRPRRIKRELFAGEALDIEAGLAALVAEKFLALYEVDGTRYLQILQWRKHQNPHHTEAESVIPAMTTVDEPTTNRARPADSLILRFSDSPIPKSKDKAKAKAPRRAAPLTLPEWLSAEDWKAWHEYRSTTGKRWTEHAQRLSVRTLDKLREQGNDPRAVIEQSIENGWTGLFQIKSGGGRNGKRGQGVADRVLAHARRAGHA